MRGRVFAAAMTLGLSACAEDLRPIEGTTTRSGTPVVKAPEHSEAELYLFGDRSSCHAAVGPAEADACTPRVDRASGTVSVAFEVRVAGSPWPVPLHERNVTVLHDGQHPSEGDKRFTLVPHDPRPTKQHIVLLVDGSGSMAIIDGRDGRSRMDKVKDALRRRDVVDAFFPEGEGVESAVTAVAFRDGKVEPIGGRWLYTDPAAYRQAVTTLEVGRGYTYLYDAVRWGATTLMEQPEIRKHTSNRQLLPTVIALTDGFNNERPEDTCGDNAPRLQRLLEELLRLRSSGDVRSVPRVYTVGLGRRARKNFEKPSGTSVTPIDLCGRGNAVRRVDGDLENRGVDNAALEWIAVQGDGESFVSRDVDGLATAFKAAAPRAYRWFEARYTVDPLFLRRSFDATVRLEAMAKTEATIRLHPSGWLDAPPGTVGPDGRVKPVSFAATAALVMPVLGSLVALHYLPPALFNVRRALFSRVIRARRR
jgi:hypothetical protein